MATLRRVCEGAGLHASGTLEQAVQAVTAAPLEFEREVRLANQWLRAQNKKCLLVFDALDRLGSSWEVIRPRTTGLLRLALQVRSSNVLRCKIFMRPDQAADSRLFDFPDASKLLHDQVPLLWSRSDLYGLLFHQLWYREDCRDALVGLAGTPAGATLDMNLGLPKSLLEEDETQARYFYRLAGEFMGAGPTKGRTYSWLHDHLGDGAGEVSPRTFMTALVEAAGWGPQSNSSPLSHRGLIFGVQKASHVRLAQLKEDYAWIDETLKPLEGLQVPFEPGPFIQRWKERKTTQNILAICRASGRLPPVSLADAPLEPEEKLLDELIRLKVVERRTNGKINVPDIYRVAAGIKRKGGIRPPSGKKAG